MFSSLLAGEGAASTSSKSASFGASSSLEVGSSSKSSARSSATGCSSASCDSEEGDSTSGAGASERSLSLGSGSSNCTKTWFATGDSCPLTGLDSGESDMVTETSRSTCCKTTMSVMILWMELVTAQGHVAGRPGDPETKHPVQKRQKMPDLSSLSHRLDASDGDEAEG